METLKFLKNNNVKEKICLRIPLIFTKPIFLLFYILK